MQKINAKELINRKEARFLLAGSVTFLSEYVVFYILYVFLHWNLLLSNSLSFVAGLNVSFLLNRTWAFKEKDFAMKAHHQAVVYLVLAAINLLMNNLIVSGLKGIGLDPRIGKIIAILLIAISNFLIYKHLIFKTKKD